MAVVADCRTVAISAYTLMFTVNDGLAIVAVAGGVCMTVDAGERGVVRRNLVAIVANRTMVRNREPRVIERGAGPRGRRVARVAGSRITRSNVIWHRAAQS